jgi:hypothetical protein
MKQSLHLHRRCVARHVVCRFAVAGLLVLVGCGAESLIRNTAQTSQTLRASLGDGLEITLGNVGPGVFEAPTLSAAGVVRYDSVAVVPPFTPGGPNQRFYLRAIGVGQVVATFRRPSLVGGQTVVEDTLIVR